MTKPIIEVKNLSKEYIISHNAQPYYTLRDSLTNLIKKPFAYFYSKNSAAKKEKFLALDDINFSVMPGEVVGIIGKNGAGKSTILKILSQITPPTRGSAHLKGRVASLLEVGTGFHPELTGRENIFLNGAILGMTRKEILKKFDEIVAFAEIEKFLDTPVKRYSSGMYVRLAFAVAAHLEPEILIVDEVLAVGDAAFQKKCLGKMDEISKKDGRTVIFVSHNMGAISNLCQTCILLENGKIILNSSTQEVIDLYKKRTQEIIEIPLAERIDRGGNGKVKISNLKISNSDNDLTIKSFDKLKIVVNISGLNKGYDNLQLILGFYDVDGRGLFRIDTGILSTKKIKNFDQIVINTSKLNITPNLCNVNIALNVDGQLADYIANVFSFSIHEKQIDNAKAFDRRLAVLLIKHCVEDYD